MDQTQFKSLAVGHRVTHPRISNIMTIVHVEKSFDFDSPIRPIPSYTWAFTTDDGRRMKLPDEADLKVLELVPDKDEEADN